MSGWTLDAYAEDFVNHAGGARGAEAWKRIFKALVERFPDARYTIEDVIAEGDKVVVVATMRGTHPASSFPALVGIEPTGREGSTAVP
jgi:predicted ester cyclase